MTQPFTFSLVPLNLPQIRHGVATWADVDGDGDLDVFVSGESESGIVTSLYRNDGKEPGAGSSAVDSAVVFTLVQQPFENVTYSRAAWGDFDRDGDLDLIVQGSRTPSVPYQPVTTLYRNESGRFSRVDAAEFVGLHSGLLKWVDFDNDGDSDLLVAGEDAEAIVRTILYENTGGGAFRAVETDLIDVAYGDADWADFDGDGDFDLALAGVTSDGFKTRIYENDAGTLREHGAPLEGVAFASLAWADHDGDGDPDLLLTGARMGSLLFDGRTQLYRNDDGSFTPVDADIPPAFAGSVSWGDYDSDGDIDAYVVGAEVDFGHRTARLYAAEDGELVLKSYLVGGMFTSADWGDMENDGDLDLLASGQAFVGRRSTILYENKRQARPSVGAVPASTAASVRDGEVLLSWNDSTGISSASFALRVGTARGRSDVVAPATHSETGRRLAPRTGNAGSSAKWILRNLTPGTYYWAVQSINAAYQPSPFSPEGTFRIDSVGTDAEESNLPTVFRVYPNYPNPFSDETTVRIDLPVSAHVEMVIYDVLGAVVSRVVDGAREAGIHSITWQGRDAANRRIPSGIYFYRIRAGNLERTGRMVLVR